MTLDSASTTLFVPRTNHVDAIDTATGSVVGAVSGLVDARSIALDASGKYGYIADIMDGRTGYVRVFDRSSYELAGTIAVGRIPTVVVFDPVTKSVYALSLRDRNVSIIDAETQTVVATLPLPAKPHLAVTSGKGAVFITFRGSGQIMRIDTATRTVNATWMNPLCDEFTGLTVDAPDGQLLGSCVNGKLIAIQEDTGKVSMLGQGPNDGKDLSFDAKHGLLVSGSNSGELSVYRRVSANQFTRAQQLPTMAHAGTIAIDPQTGRVYLATAQFAHRPVDGPNLEELESRLMPVPDSFLLLVVGR